MARIGMWLPPTAIIVTCGGWDAERYAGVYRSKLEKLGVKVIGREIVKQKRMGSPMLAAQLAEDIDGWVGMLGAKSLDGNRKRAV